MPPEDHIRIQHMLEAATKARALTQQRQREDLQRDEPLLMALIKYLEIIGEAASKMSTQTQQDYPSIPWREIVGMRNHLIHVYFNVNVNVIWRTIEDDLPPLIAELERILKTNGHG